MHRIIDFEPQLASALPAIYTLLVSSNLTVHPSVTRVVLHGSRGLAGGCRPDSDIDLSLIVDLPPGLTQPELEHLLQDVVETTLDHWQSSIELDLAVVFDKRNCGLKCFNQAAWSGQTCETGGVDCFGVYKIQKGFGGLVTNAGVQVKLMLPCLTIWV